MSSATRAFTLVEMLVVIAIIGILASITITSLSSARAHGRDSKRVTEVGQIALSLSLFYDTCKSYPDASGGLTLDDTRPGCPAGKTFDDFMVGEIPLQPDGTAYGYASDNVNAVVYATLESSHAALADDLDGTVQGVDCDDPVYCKSP